MPTDLPLLDQVHLEVENDPPAHPNLLPNPTPQQLGDARDGAWGWLTPGPGDSFTWPGYDYFQYTAAVGGGSAADAVFTSEFASILPGQYAAATAQITGLSHYYKLGFEWRDSAGAFISKTMQGSFHNTVTTWNVGPSLAPAGAAYVALRVERYQTNAGGDVTDAANHFHFKRACLVKGATAAEITALGYVEHPGWTSVLDSAVVLDIEREPLNIGTLNTLILSEALDPADVSLIRPGKKVRAWAGGLGRLFDYDTALFYGEVHQDTSVTYDLKDPAVPDAKRARINLIVQDETATLAQITRPYGYYDAALGVKTARGVLEGCGVPWLLNNDADQGPSGAIVSVNETATALDQLSLTRDTHRAYGWANRTGVLHLFNDPNTVIGYNQVTLDESAYTDFDSSFAPGNCINAVTINYLRHNPSTGQTESLNKGTWRDEDSIREWGHHPAEFTLHGIPEADVPAFAQAVLATNATPTLRINSVTVRVGLLTDVNYNSIPTYATLDLYQRCRVINAEKGVDQVCHITGIKHRITTTGWYIDLTFSKPGTAASPTAIPTPGTGAEGKTLSQLLRPVGEVTMFYGTPSQVPDGWLVCNGATFTATDYPELNALLGGNTLPNLTDRFPIGAGTKALGTSGGAPTKTLVEANLPPHVHGGPPLTLNSSTAVGSDTTRVARGTGTGAGSITPVGGSTGPGNGTSTPVDVMPPWRAIYFIIRAR